MIIELSKDKSLHNILSKVDLDKETKELVDTKASPLEIKKSLERNLNSTNLVQYRKYILKAEEEEDLGGKTVGFEESDYADSGKDVVDSSLDEEQRIESAEREDLRSQSQAHKKAYKDLSSLISKTDAMEDISQTASVIRTDGKLLVRGAMREYLRVGTLPVKSSKLLDELALIKKNPNYLKDKYKDLLVEGILSGKDIKVDKTGELEEKENTKKNINVNSLSDRITTLLKLEFIVEGSEDKIDFHTLLTRLHVQQHGREPDHLKDRPRIKRERRNMLLISQGKNPQIEKEYDTAIKELNKLNKRLGRVLTSKRTVEETIESLEETLNDSEKLVARKLEKLNSALRTLVSRGSIDNEEIKGKLKQLKDFSKNKERYVREATQEVEETIEVEKKKLEQIIFDLDVAERVRPSTKEFKRIVNIFKDSNPIAAVKELIIEGISIVTYMQLKARTFERVASRAEEDIEDGLQSFMEDNPDVALRLDADGLSFDGMPTIDADGMRRIDELSDDFSVKQGELEEIVNRLNNLIEGEKPQPQPKTTVPEDAKPPTKDGEELGEFNIRDYVYEKPKKGEE